MCRVIVHSGRPWPTAGVFFLVGSVVAVRVDGVLAEDFAGVGVDDGDGVVVDEEERGSAGVVAADAEVVEFAGPAEGEFSAAVPWRRSCPGGSWP
jgi:hypothetical protein